MNCLRENQYLSDRDQMPFYNDLESSDKKRGKWAVDTDITAMK